MKMQKIEKNGIICAVINAEEPVITDAQTALDVLMSAKYDIGTKILSLTKGLLLRNFLS